MIINLNDINFESFLKKLFEETPFTIFGVKPLNNHFELFQSLIKKISSLFKIDMVDYISIIRSIPNELYFPTPQLKSNQRFSKIQNQLSPPYTNN